MNGNNSVTVYSGLSRHYNNIILFQTIHLHVQCVYRVIMKKQGVAVHVRSTYYTTVMSIGYGGPTYNTHRPPQCSLQLG